MSYTSSIQLWKGSWVTPSIVSRLFCWTPTAQWDRHCSTHWFLWVNKNSAELQKRCVCVCVCVCVQLECVGEGEGGLWSEMGKGQGKQRWHLEWLCSPLIPPHPCICVLSLVFPHSGCGFPTPWYFGCRAIKENLGGPAHFYSSGKISWNKLMVFKTRKPWHVFERKTKLIIPPARNIALPTRFNYVF